MADTNGLYSLEDMYGKPALSDEAWEALLARSLQPRGPVILYDALASLGLNSSHTLLDIGCRDASHACQIAQRFRCTVLGVEPVPYQLEQAAKMIARSGQGQRVTVRQGRIETIPALAETFDFIWCRDVISHVPDLPVAFRECGRVLKPGGRMVIYATFATNLLEPAEAARLYPPLAVVAANMSPVHVEANWRAAGLRTILHDLIASEWREFWEEDGTRHTSKQLLTLARLRRDRSRFIAELGEKPYETTLADCHWGVYQMLGKLCPTLYVVERPAV